MSDSSKVCTWTWKRHKKAKWYIYYPRESGCLPVSNYTKTAAQSSSSWFFFLPLSNHLPWSYILKGFTSLMITYSRSVQCSLQAIFYCSFFKGIVFGPDACSSFHHAIVLLKTQPEILLGNRIPKCSNTVNSRQFALLSGFTQHSPGLSTTIYRQLRDTEEAHKGHPGTTKDVWIISKKCSPEPVFIKIQTSIALTHQLKEMHNRKEFMFNISKSYAAPQDLLQHRAC